MRVDFLCFFSLLIYQPSCLCFILCGITLCMQVFVNEMQSAMNAALCNWGSLTITLYLTNWTGMAAQHLTAFSHIVNNLLYNLVHYDMSLNNETVTKLTCILENILRPQFTVIVFWYINLAFLKNSSHGQCLVNSEYHVIRLRNSHTACILPCCCNFCLPVSCPGYVCSVLFLLSVCLLAWLLKMLQMNFDIFWTSRPWKQSVSCQVALYSVEILESFCNIWKIVHHQWACDSCNVCMYVCMWIYIAQPLQPKQSQGASIG